MLIARPIANLKDAKLPSPGEPDAREAGGAPHIEHGRATEKQSQQQEEGCGFSFHETRVTTLEANNAAAFELSRCGTLQRPGDWEGVYAALAARSTSARSILLIFIIASIARRARR